MSQSSDTVRPEVTRLAPYNAGLTIAELMARYAPARIAKLGSNENPIGPSPRVAPAAAAAVATMRIYPDPASRDLRRALADHAGVDADRIMIGNGSEDLLAIVARATLRPGDRVVTLYPSFPLHEDYATLMGATVERVAVRPDLTVDVDGLVAALAEPCRMLIFANPMNPVGSWMTGAEFGRVAAAVSPETLVVVDEAYAEYAAGPDYPSAATMLEGASHPWVVLRTFSKAYGLAGLRVGWGIFGEAALRDLIDRVRTPFNVNAVAQAAAVAALADDAHLAEVVAATLAERARVGDALARLGVTSAPSKANFLFFDCGGDATAFAEALLARGVIVKPWKQPGYRDFARVSIGAPAENDQFLEAMAGLVGGPA
jgi:histidinol-phosphate aminotransferase